MFDRPPLEAPTVTIHVDGQAIAARAGDSVAAAMLGAGLAITRTTPVRGVPRGPYCMMGACFDCLAVIDGEASRQACMVEVRDGMRVERQSGARNLADGASAP